MNLIIHYLLLITHYIFTCSAFKINDFVIF